MSAVAFPLQQSPSPEAVTIGRHRIWAVSVLLLCVLLLALGAWATAAFWKRDPRILLVGPLLVVVSTWAASLMVSRLRSGYATYIGPDGLTIPGPTFRPKLISWDDVEAIGSFKIRANGFTGIKLKTYAHLIPQYTQEEIRILLRRNRWLGRGLSVIGPISTVQSGMYKLLESTKECDALTQYFTNQRQVYGYDVYLLGIDRDRSADAFAAYLEGFRAKYSHLSSRSPTPTPESVHA